MNKSVANVLYTIIGLLLIAIATCALGTCPWWGNQAADEILPTSEQDLSGAQSDTTDDDITVPVNDTGAVDTGSIDTGDSIEVRPDVLDDPDADEYDPSEFEDDEVEELLQMLEEMLDIN